LSAAEDLPCYLPEIFFDWMIAYCSTFELGTVFTFSMAGSGSLIVLFDLTEI